MWINYAKQDVLDWQSGNVSELDDDQQVAVQYRYRELSVGNPSCVAGAPESAPSCVAGYACCEGPGWPLGESFWLCCLILELGLTKNLFVYR